jgi:hypothetical protein
MEKKNNGKSEATVELTSRVIQQLVMINAQQRSLGVISTTGAPSAGPAPSVGSGIKKEGVEVVYEVPESDVPIISDSGPIIAGTKVSRERVYLFTAEQKAGRADPELTRFSDLGPGDVLSQVAGATGVTHTCTVTEEVIRDYCTIKWIDQDGVEDGSGTMGPFKDNKTILKSAGISLVQPIGITAPKEKPKKSSMWDSVILPDDHKKQIEDAISQVNNHAKIFDEWGFGEVFEKGTAISLLFYGPPGTGKTLAGQAIADELDYKLQVIGTADIETPEPGGAERNINQFFAKAMSSKTILLFDECDSLITDRTNVGMIVAAQINNLLSQLEKFTGIAIFTTNRLASLDPAFERRLSLKLEFTMPDHDARVKIWRRMFPSKAPLSKDIRWNDLASVPIAGGHIKNTVLKAARTAANAGHTEITDEVLWNCLEKEVASAEAMQEAIEGNTQFYGTPLKGRAFTKNDARTRKVIGG